MVGGGGGDGLLLSTGGISGVAGGEDWGGYRYSPSKSFGGRFGGGVGMMAVGHGTTDDTATDGAVTDPALILGYNCIFN